MSKQLNIDGDNYDQFFSQIIDNVEYILHVYYNHRSGWYVSFYDATLYKESAVENSEALIYGGRKLMPNQQVLLRISDDRLPKGLLYCVDTEVSPTEDQVQLTIDNFGVGRRYNLIYFTEGELS